MAGLSRTLSYLPGCSTAQHQPSPPPSSLAWRTQMKSCLSWPPNVWLVMKCALIWSPVECISRRQQAEGSRQQKSPNRHRESTVGIICHLISQIEHRCLHDRQERRLLRSMTFKWYAKSEGRLLYTASSRVYTCTVYLVYTRDPHECIHCALDSTTQLGTAFLLYCTWNEV